MLSSEMSEMIVSCTGDGILPVDSSNTHHLKRTIWGHNFHSHCENNTQRLMRRNVYVCVCVWMQQSTCIPVGMHMQNTKCFPLAHVCKFLECKAKKSLMFNTVFISSPINQAGMKHYSLKLNVLDKLKRNL